MKLLQPKRLRVGAALLVSVAVVAAVAVTTAASRSDGSETVVAVFKSASSLVPGNDVQEHGVKVGDIQDIQLVDNTAHVVMKIDPEVLPLHRDARAEIRPVSLLGERFIELTPGTPAKPAMDPDNAVIPMSRTGAAVDLDQVLNTLNDPTSTGLAALVTTLGEGGAGRGQDAADAVRALAPAMEDTGRLADVLNQQNGLLAHMVTTAQASTSAVTAGGGAKLDSLLDSAQRTLATTSRNREALDATLHQLPDTLSSAKTTLAHLGGVADATTPTLRSLRPVTGNLTQISGEVKNFSDAADPAMASLPAVLNRLNTMLDEARPVADELRPAASGLNKTVGKVRPVTDALINHKTGTPSALENLMDGVGDWAMTTNGYDGISHYFRGILVGTTGSLSTAVNGAVPGAGNLLPANSDPEQPGQRSVLPVPNLPILTDGKLPLVPGLVPHPQNPIGIDLKHLPPVPGLVGPAQNENGTKSAPADPDNATGLTQGQESNLLGQLLGGGN